ncbi:hypothetical protein CHLRE_12g485550v5 [Chlamydomonas reinhardtii]|uniref:hydroxymethylglutaryl-CoA lyase n=1 Tax=Chlamydomonas reinhardtii TaxID=3055 RepID=A0A2K3D1S8_CHLRE|nr:hydroxymethylglutaryl-CoA lyase [Chlamydomonas reinhardtii]PNW74477.1 hypothetical protein CHLRE_12g485550v5 [Chlamydomonas reinhardtii]
MRNLQRFASALCGSVPGAGGSALPRLAAPVGVARSLSTLPNGLPSSVTIYEVGPRDGLQNEKKVIPADVKVAFIDLLSGAGFKAIEATSFVSPKWVPQLGDAAEVVARMRKAPGVEYPVLTPNMKGLAGALAAGCREVAVFAAASEAFSRKNINCSVRDSLKRFEEVVVAARKEGVKVRGYVSCAVGCPIQGAVEPAAAADVGAALHHMGCYEVSMADTIGVGTPASMERMLGATLAAGVPAARLAVHCHDTYGMAVANIIAAMRMGVAVVDASVAGLGGCPYARGATGNVATEDVMYMLDGYGISHGLDWGRVLDASEYISAALGRPNGSRAAKALLARRADAAEAAAEAKAKEPKAAQAA